MRVDTLLGRVGIVTGGAKGIGKAVALAIADSGANVALLDIDLEKACQTADEIRSKTGRQVDVYNVDVSVKSEVEKAVLSCFKSFGQIDIIVNNAGIWGYGKLTEVIESDWDKIFAVNLKGVLFGIQTVAPIMKKQKRGKIINIASAAGLSPVVQWSAYCISKAAVIMLTKVAAEELKDDGVEVNCICPGAVDTDLSQQITKLTGERFPHAMSPEDVAKAVLELVCPFARKETGQIKILVKSDYLIK